MFWKKENATILDLFSGVIVLVIGAFLFMNPQVVVKLLTLMLGAFILVDSIWMLRGSMKLRKRKLGVWKAFLIESLVFVGLGVLILVNPFSELRLTMQVSGWIFVANGALDIIFYLILRHGMKKEIPTEDETKEKDGSKAEAASDEKKEAGNTDAPAADAGNASGELFSGESVKNTEGISEEGAKNTDNVPEENSKNAGNDSEESAENTEAVSGEASGESEEAEEVLEEWKD